MAGDSNLYFCISTAANGIIPNLDLTFRAFRVGPLDFPGFPTLKAMIIAYISRKIKRLKG